MREILFRAKEKNKKEWVEGYYAKMGKGNIIRHYIVQNCALTDLFNTVEDNMYFNDVEIDPETLCQYTGLKDKNGNRIWENDIVRCNRREKEAKYMVVWDKTYADFRIEKLNGLGIMPICIEEGNVPIFGRHYECIGNIFDNPELWNRRTGKKNNDDLISRKALREAVKKYRDSNFIGVGRESYALSYVIGLINNQPTAFETMRKPERRNENGQEEINTR